MQLFNLGLSKGLGSDLRSCLEPLPVGTANGGMRKKGQVPEMARCNCFCLAGFFGLEKLKKKEICLQRSMVFFAGLIG